MKALTVLSLALGAAAWSAAEYGLHRFVGHGPRRKRPTGPLAALHPSSLLAGFAEEHVAHHADPTYFAPDWKKASAALVVVPALAGLGSLVAGPRRGTAFALGFVGSYLGYEVLHRRIHTKPPRSPYTRWVYKNHLSHHVSPKVNHGVSSPLWDLAGDTSRPTAGPLKLHVRIAPEWLKDPTTGAARKELADDYEIVSPRPRTALEPALAS